jgi:hypothetical protein
MSDPEAHIAAWEAAGVIDGATAARLRAAPVIEPGLASAGHAQGDHSAAIAPAADASEASTRPASAVSALFGPGVSIGEMFGYIGAAFLLSAWSAFLVRTGDSTGNAQVVVGIGSLVAAAVLTGLGAWLRRGPDRFRRAAGVAFLTATGLVGVSVLALLASTGQRDSLAGVVAAGAALLAAIAYRTYLPAVLTHLGVLAGATSLAATTLSWIRTVLVPLPTYDDFGNTVSVAGPSADPLLLAVGQAAAWVLLAIVIGFVGLREARAGTPEAGRRASVSRAWAGFVVVLGITQAVTQSRTDADFTNHRVVEPWLGALIILIVCAVLIERAFHRESSAFVYPAALGFVIAATDLNVTYLSSTIEIALLVEGGVLLGAGVIADRLRRRLGARPPALGPVAAVT